MQYLVGTGTFARVFRAVHKDNGQVVAVKALRNRFSEIPSQYSLFLREGELGRTLRHPNIVPIYEVHSIKNQHFLVMEFIEGRNLREFVKVRKSLTALEATRLMLEEGTTAVYQADPGVGSLRSRRMTGGLAARAG